MAEKRKEIKEKLVKKYRLVVLTEETYEEKFSFKLTRLNVFVFGGLFSILLISLTSFIIVYTPLKEYIPGFESPDLKKNMIVVEAKLDSLNLEFHSLELFTESLKPVLIGDNAIELRALPYTTNQGESVYHAGVSNNDSIHKKIDQLYALLDQKNHLIHQFQQKFKLIKIDSVRAVREIEKVIAALEPESGIEVDEQLNSSPQDSIFRANVEREERFSIYNRKNNKLDLAFVSPIQGNITQSFDRSQDHYAVDIATDFNSPVKAISDGVVVFAEWSANTGYVLVLVHDYNYISVYKHNNNMNVVQGDLVKAGQVIANVGSTGVLSTGPHLHFEMWKDGYPVDPTNFMKF